MVFSSATFLFLFLPITLILYFIRLFPENQARETAKKNFVLLAVFAVSLCMNFATVIFRYFFGMDKL